MMNPKIITLYLIIFSFMLHGCATQNETSKSATFRVVKVNRVLRMHSLQGEGFEIIGQKKARAMAINDFSLDYDDRGEDIVVTWKYNGPALQNAPIKLYFDYSYPNEKEIFRVEENYPTVVPGRYIFKFRNTGDDYYSKGKIETWRVMLYYDNEIVDQKKSSFFGKS